MRNSTRLAVGGVAALAILLGVAAAWRLGDAPERHTSVVRDAGRTAGRANDDVLVSLEPASRDGGGAKESARGADRRGALGEASAEGSFEASSGESPVAAFTGPEFPPESGAVRDGIDVVAEPDSADSAAPWIAAPADWPGDDDSALALFDVAGVAGRPEARLVGFDADAPRQLMLWEVDVARGRAAELASTASAAGGLIRAENLLLSSGAFALIVAPVGADPFGPLASAPFDVDALPVEPPQAWLEPPCAALGGASGVTVAVTGGGFTLIVGDSDGRALDFFAVPEPSLTQRAPRMLTFEVGGDAQQVARREADGRRSAWVALR